ncbi:MAG: glycoside hydrolase family 16 protein [Opitutales bacterium]
MRLAALLLATNLFAAPPAGEGYTRTFADEFDGNALNAAHWNAQDQDRRDARNSPRAVTVTGGVLTLTTFTENGKHFTGYVLSAGKFEQAQGYFEARIRFNSAPGMWAAFWMMPKTYGKSKDPAKANIDGVEIDIVEHLAQFGGHFDTTIHWGGYGKPLQRTRTQRNKPAKPANEGWHTYAVQWEADGYRFFYDDQLAWKAPNDIPVSQAPQHLLLTCEVKDKGWAGAVPVGGFGGAENSKVRMEVDWVRAWKKSAAR